MMKSMCIFGIVISLACLFIIFEFYVNDTMPQTLINHFYAVTESEEESVERKMKKSFEDGNLCKFITFDYAGRTGNQMFEYASFYGLAKANKKIPFIQDKEFPLLDIFNLTVPVANRSYFSEQFSSVPNYGDYKFGEDLFNLDCNMSFVMGGFRHSWKYFDRYREEIVKEFTFNDDVSDACNEVLENVTKQNNVSRSKCIFVGAHMRRGDFVKESKQDYGHVPASADYLNRSVDFFQSAFANHSCLLFLVLGDDFKWNLKNSPEYSNVVVIEPNNASVDLCILTRCNHSIMSSGTFSWWSAYLAGGKTTYMKNQCRPGSSLCSMINPTDFIKPEWNWHPL